MLSTALQALVLASVQWARPMGLWTLLLPPIVILLSRLRSRPPARVVGTVAIWRRVEAEESPRGARSSRRVPLAVWLAAGALACAGLALGGPRQGQPPRPRLWTVVVDRSPSVGLEFLAADGTASGASGSRQALALAQARAELERVAGPLDRVRWVAREREALELDPGLVPPAQWLAPGRGSDLEVSWPLFDRPGALWITDRVPALEPLHAGVFASGGAGVYGPIAQTADGLVVWEGGLQPRVDPERSLARRVRLSGAAAGHSMPAPLARIFRTWAEATVFENTDGSEPDLALVLAPAPGTSVPVRAKGRNWSIEGRAPGAGLARDPVPTGREPWLGGARTDDAGGAGAIAIPLVDHRPGEVRVALTQLAEPAGDPAAFAVDFATLFDLALLPPRGAISVGERAAVGEGLSRAGSTALELEVSDEAPSTYSIWESRLALGAALFTLAALSSGLFRSR